MPTFADDPTSAYLAYDWEAFDWSFEVMDIVPTFDEVIVYREFAVVAVGQAVTVVAHIQDIMTTLGQRYNFDPDTTPQITIYNPDGSVAVATTDMNFVAVGYYNYQHQTLVTDQLGVYTAVFKAVNGTMTGTTAPLSVFKVI
jgi:hypothetical protein